MKKILLVLMAIVLTFGLVACSSGNPSGGQNSANNISSAQTSSESSKTQSSSETTTSSENSETQSSSETTTSSENSETQSSSETSTSSENSETQSGAETSTSEQSSESTQSPEQPDQSQTKALVVYFSATGNTKSVAETLAGSTGADIYEIVPEQPYTAEDLNYNDRSTRATAEQNDPNARPAISGGIDNLDQYDVIYVGYPIWWGDMPRILYTFFDTYDLSGKTIAPFCTSGGSGLSGTPRTIAGLESGATVLDGLHVSDSSANNAQSRVNEWLTSIGQAA